MRQLAARSSPKRFENGKPFQYYNYEYKNNLFCLGSYFKDCENGGAAMSKIMEGMREEIREETKTKTAINLIKLGKLTIEEIAQVLDLSVEKVAELAKTKNI